MKTITNQQIAISGIGGQGVLFITKLLAQTALEIGCSVLIAETHGMAQRGGNVISHLKINKTSSASDSQQSNAPRAIAFSSPLIRPGEADVLLALHPDGRLLHGFYLAKTGILFCNSPAGKNGFFIDASQIAMSLGSPISANLVLTGFAAASGKLFASSDEIESVLKTLGATRLEINLRAFRAGVEQAGV